MATAKKNTEIYEEVRWTQQNFSTVHFREKAENCLERFRRSSLAVERVVRKQQYRS